jgi:prepilin-type N-terminal cleavage/methylation domain-containing protein
VREINKGFTLLEIMLVIGIIVILSSVFIPKSGFFKGMAKDAGVEANLHTVEALVTQMIYDWGSSDDDNDDGSDDSSEDSRRGYRYYEGNWETIEGGLQGLINPGGAQSESDLENPVTKVKGMAEATASGTVTSFSGGAVAYVKDSSGSNEWPDELADLRGAVGVSAFIDEGGKLKVKLVGYDSNGVKFHNETIIVRH